MHVEWDEIKNRINIQKHGIDFNDVVDMFKESILSKLDNSENYGEERWIGIGWLKNIIAVIVYTERKNELIRIISARKATKQEVNYYEQWINPN